MVRVIVLAPPSKRGLYIYLTPAQHDALVKESLAKLADESKPSRR